ncbi:MULTISPECIES: cation:proton antiporter [unclassified Variovorax]|uniref:cation:proton antiporter n=1 Tax=unclassified Variovorax TaxID=663243 RepID=UPI003F45A9CB
MTAATWDLMVGALLILMALSGTLLKTLPISAAALYMGLGFIAGPGGFNLVKLGMKADAGLVETIAEVAVLVSLFAVGLRLRIRMQVSSWFQPVLLATAGMVITIALMTLAGLALHLTLASALLLAAILAPTDPVLASDVQVRHENDQDDLRFGLTAEGGLNDGAAFPFVMLALGLAGAHELGTGGLRWLGLDVVWAVGGGLALGWTCGAAFTRLVLFLQNEKKQAMGMESFLALGLIALTYGIALHASVYGFLAVFVAGLSMRNVEHAVEDKADEARTGAAPREAKVVAIEQARTAGAMTRDVLAFAKELEKFVELAAMLVIGCLLRTEMLTFRNLLIAGVLVAIARPVAVYISTLGGPWSASQRRLGAWFGIRGVGSIYYLAYASTHGAPSSEIGAIGGAVLVTVALSVVVHGISATPLMNIYQAAGRRRR